MMLLFPYPVILENDDLFRLFERKDMAGLQEALRCIPSYAPEPEPRSLISSPVPTEVDIPLTLTPVGELYGSIYEASSQGQPAFDACRGDSAIAPGFNYPPSPNSSVQNSLLSQPQQSLLAVAGGVPAAISLDATAQHLIEHSTSTVPSAARTPRTPLALNSFNFQYPMPYQQPPPFSANGPQDAGAFSFTQDENFELENQHPYQNPSLSLTTTTAAFTPRMSSLNHSQHPVSGQPSQPGSEKDSIFHNEVTPAEVPHGVRAKSQKMALGRELTGGQQHKSGKFWRLSFSYSTPGSRLEHICDNASLPTCNHSTTALGDMKRHQETSSHLSPESRTLTCPLCGTKFKGLRSDSMKRHQRLQVCMTKQLEAASEAAQLDVPSTSSSQVGGKRSWTGDEAGNDEHPAKVARNEKTD